MTSTLVDSNVLIDVLRDPDGSNSWSSECVETAGDLGAIVINPIILAEVAIGFNNLDELERLLAAIQFSREALPWEAAFYAGRAHALYRRRGGVRDRTLPDFFIGAHAKVKGHRLLTRDARRYRAHFPDLEIIAPDTHP
jgi:predicted nucleic acid-binding protein